MKPKGLLAIVVAAGAVVAGALSLPKTPAQPQQGQKELIGMAPAFTGKLSDGKEVDLASLTKDGPVYLYFVKKDCPINAQAVGFYNSIFDAYKGKGNIVAVFNGDEKELKAYNDEHHMPFTKVVLDPEQKIIKSYLAERSPWVVEVTKQGLVGDIWKGYSKGYLTALSTSVAKGAGVDPAKLEFKEAPERPRYG